MTSLTLNLYYLLAIPFAPLVGAFFAGILGKKIGRRASHTVTILGVLVACVLSALTLMQVLKGAGFNATVYEWARIGSLKFEIGFLVDTLTAIMMCVVTFVSLMVHIYTIGYMAEDPGYQRFFAYISLFTFAMLMLVMSNNFLQLFFGWEAVGLVSYLLIGFWYTRPTAIYANLKAFLVNRVGDFGFLLGIGLIFAYSGSLNYADVFAQGTQLSNMTFPGTNWNLLTVACLGLFVGAMGKSAPFPLHVWLPDSMEGPTPISALIHAATMVTAGIFMVSRMSPLFELSDTVLSFITIIGAITALFMGLLGMVQNDIKRVIAYSTLSQLGYMTVALGVSAYPIAIFHLMTHAFFKALLFLSAGSVIMGMHHQQDMRYMGGLKKYMPITWITTLIGSLALIGTPFFSGFYSKDSIIEAVSVSHIAGAGFAYIAVVGGVFVTAFYTFRMFFMTFHGQERFDQAPVEHGHEHDHHSEHAHVPHESPWVVTIPLILLAIPSLFIGAITIHPILFSDLFAHGLAFKNVIFMSETHAVLKEIQNEFHGWINMAYHALTSIPFALSVMGVLTAWWLCLKRPAILNSFQKNLRPIYVLLDNKYYLDKFNEVVFAKGAVGLGRRFSKFGDQFLIDGVLVNGMARLTTFFARLIRPIQSGYLYHYAFAMIAGMLGLMTWFIFK